MIVHSPASPVAIPDVDLPAFLLAEAASRGARPAYVDGPTGSYFRMKACAEGIEAETQAGTLLRERLAHLPAI